MFLIQTKEVILHIFQLYLYRIFQSAKQGKPGHNLEGDTETKRWINCQPYQCPNNRDSFSQMSSVTLIIAYWSQHH